MSDTVATAGRATDPVSVRLAAVFLPAPLPRQGRMAFWDPEDGPLPDSELATILENSKYSGPVCGQLDADVNCGDQCILAKHDGLYTRKGGAHFAQPGERVVIEVIERTSDGKVLEVAHPDAVQGRIILNGD